jgi:electron transfer flavoprotein alpha subunit
MSVVVYTESWEGKFKKASFEAVSYAARTASQIGTDVVAVVIGSCSEDLSSLGYYGANQVIHYSNPDFNNFNPKSYASILTDAVNNRSAQGVVLSGSFNGKAIAPLLAIRLKAGLITNVASLPESISPMRVKRGAFSSKGFVVYESKQEKFILSIIPNGIGIVESSVSAQIETNESFSAEANSELVSVNKAKGSIPLPEAEIVVSGGRGLKGPENWNMVEELATVLGAGTACSKPVSDMHWRPHSEHVGQTGIAINPNLYIAIGISGAIQHLAGVSNSRTIVVINSDPEAPFFKAADYGIVGDAFDVVPKLTAALKEFKAQN